MSARRQIIDELTPLLPTTWRVVGYADLPDQVAKPTVSLWVDSYEPRGDAAGTYQATVQVWALTKFQDMSKAEDDLDEMLEVLLPALKQIPFIEFDRAERGVLDDTFHGYNIQAHVPYVTIGE